MTGMTTQTLPVLDLHRAKYVANMKIAQRVSGSTSTAIGYQADNLNVTASCFLGTCPERTEYDKQVAQAQIRHRCLTCGLLRADWNPHHPAYLADATECPQCRTR